MQGRSYFLIVLFIFLLTVSNAQAVLVDRIAAVIDGEVITYIDVQAERAFKLSIGTEAGVVQSLIDRRLLLMEAQKFRMSETEEETQKTQVRLQEIIDELGSERFYSTLKEYNLTQEGLIKKIKDKYLADKFINFRINFFVIIPDNAIRTYYNENIDEFSGRQLEEVYSDIKARLFQIESGKRLQDYMVQLRNKAKIMINQPVNE